MIEEIFSHKSGISNFNLNQISKYLPGYRLSNQNKLSPLPNQDIILQQLPFYLDNNIQTYSMEQQNNIEPNYTLFTNQSKQELFDILASNVKFNEKPFTEQDFKVDLVIRLRVPTQAIIPKDFEITVEKIFKNLPPQYEEVYQEILQYVYYLTATDPNSRLNNLPDTTITTRCMTTLKALMRSEQVKKKYVDNRLDEEDVFIDCEYQYLPFLDTFTVFYNMLMVVLERVCGFHVRTFLMENNEDSGYQNTNVVYFLLSQSNENLIKMADKVQLKKEMDMRDIDYTINDPTDKKGRPIKFHSYFKSQPDFKQFLYNEKILCRTLGIKQLAFPFESDICEEASLSQVDATKYKEYFAEIINSLVELHRKNDISISHWDKSFLFDFNRHKLNNGCILLYYEKQLKRLFYDKLKQINKKYGYPYYQYSDSFFQFRMLSRSKPFFQRLSHMLNYKRYTMNRSGQLSLFSKLQRIKLCYVNLERYFKIQKFGQFGMDVYALHDNFQKYGDLTHEDNNVWRQNQSGEPPKANIVTLQSAWRPFLPFRCDIKKIRDYMGQKMAFQIMIKIYLSTYFLLLIPISAASEVYLIKNQAINYKYSLIVLLVMVTSLNLFIAIWTKAENWFFDNFNSSPKEKTYRDGYQGPYYRNLTNDEPNSHNQDRTIKQRLQGAACYLIIIAILVLQAVFFWAVRLAIVYTYQEFNLVQWRYLSVPHLIFYGVFYIVNQFLYYVVFLRVIEVLVKWQQYPTLQSHERVVRSYRVFLTFGIQMLPPLFFYIVQQQIQHVSCYAAQCHEQFAMFIYSRYEILFINIFFKFYKCIWFMFDGALSKFVIDGNARITQYLSFQGRLNYLLNYVRNQYKREDKKQDLRTESLGLFYYVIYKITFPPATGFTFLMLQLEYIFERLQHLNSNRRPIPVSNAMFRLQGTFRSVLRLCILFNAWAITFSFEFVEYDLSEYIGIFVKDITADNLLSLKLVVTLAIFIIYEAISYVLGFLFSSLLNNPLQERKKMMYKKYLNKIRSKPSKIKLPALNPLKTIFRTFTQDSILEHKKNKYKIYEIMKKAMLKYQGLSLFHTNRRLVASSSQERKISSSSSQSIDSNHIIVTD